jgi:hypothetical protein
MKLICLQRFESTMVLFMSTRLQMKRHGGVLGQQAPMKKKKSTWGAFGGRIPPNKKVKAFLTNKPILSFY